MIALAVHSLTSGWRGIEKVNPAHSHISCLYLVLALADRSGGVPEALG